MKSSLQFALGVLVLAGSAWAGGRAMAADDTFFAQTTVQTPITAQGLVATKILSITVPAGNWVAWGKAEVVEFFTEDIARCHLFLNSTEIDSSANQIGGKLPFVSVEPTQAAFTVSAPTKVVLGCSHDTAHIKNVYVDPDASLMIIAAPGGIN
jgi:hypothetical protein